MKKKTEKKMEKSTINKIIKIVRENRNLPTNDIKRIVKKEIPYINGDEFYDILIKYSDTINNREEESER